MVRSKGILLFYCCKRCPLFGLQRLRHKDPGMDQELRTRKLVLVIRKKKMVVDALVLFLSLFLDRYTAWLGFRKRLVIGTNRHRWHKHRRYSF